MGTNQQNEEDEEDVGDEEDWSEDTICRFHVTEVEITENGSQQCEDRVVER